MFVITVEHRLHTHMHTHIFQVGCHFTYKVLVSINSVVILKREMASVYTSFSYSSLTTHLEYTVYYYAYTLTYHFDFCASVQRDLAFDVGALLILQHQGENIDDNNNTTTTTTTTKKGQTISYPQLFYTDTHYTMHA